MRGAVIALLCGLTLAAIANGGVYSASDAPLGPIAEKDGVNPMPFDLFRSTLLDRMGLLNDPSTVKFGGQPFPENTLKRRMEQEAQAKTIENKIKAGTATLDDNINLSAALIRLGKYAAVIELLKPLADRDRAGQANFMVNSNLGTAYQLSLLGEKDKGLLRTPISYLGFARDAWPDTYPGIPDEQLRFWREAEKYHLQLVKRRFQQDQSAEKNVDALFGEPNDPVRFVGESGQYEAGKIAAKEKAKLPKDAIAIVQQLALWMPNDTRLYWLLAELLNADGQIPEALTIMDECVGEGRRFDSLELKEHRRILKAYTPPQKEQPSVLPDTQKIVLVGGVIVAVIGLLGYFQLREIRRRRSAKIGQ